MASISPTSSAIKVGNIEETRPISLKALIFDWGGVLANPDPQEIKRYLLDYFTKALAAQGVSSSAFQEMEKELDTLPIRWIRVSLEEIAFLNAFSAKYHLPALSKEWFEEYQETKKASVKDLLGIRDILRNLHDRGYRLILLSNFEAWMQDILDRLEYGRLFEKIFLSYRTGHSKPDPSAYREVIEYLQLSPSVTLFIDDQEKNITGAERAFFQEKMQVLLFRGPLDLQATLLSKGIL